MNPSFLWCHEMVPSGVLAKPERLYTALFPSPVTHLMMTLKGNQEIFLNINVKLYHLFD